MSKQETIDQTSNLPTLAMRFTAFGVIAAAAIVLYFGFRGYQACYEFLHGYHLDGLPAIALLSLLIATLSTPFFARGLAESPDGAPQNSLQVLQLYGSVLGIVFVAFGLVMLVLWILGWLKVLSYLAYRGVLRAIGLDGDFVQ